MDFINWLLNPKNACKDIKKTIFLDFFIFKDSKSCCVFYYYYYYYLC